MANTCVKYHHCMSKRNGSYHAETTFPQTDGLTDNHDENGIPHHDFTGDWYNDLHM